MGLRGEAALGRLRVGQDGAAQPGALGDLAVCGEGEARGCSARGEPAAASLPRPEPLRLPPGAAGSSPPSPARRDAPAGVCAGRQRGAAEGAPTCADLGQHRLQPQAVVLVGGAGLVVAVRLLALHQEGPRHGGCWRGRAPSPGGRARRRRRASPPGVPRGGSGEATCGEAPSPPLRAGGRLAGGGAQVAAAAAPGPPAKGPLPSFGGSTEHRRPSQRLKRQRRRPHALPGPPRPSPAAPEGQRSAGRPPRPAGPGLGGWLQNRRQPRRLRRSPPSEGPIHPQRSNVKTNEAECDPRPAAAGGATPRSCGHSETGPGGARCETSGGPRREPGGRERGRLRRLLRAAAGRTEPASASASAQRAASGRVRRALSEGSQAFTQLLELRESEGKGREGKGPGPVPPAPGLPRTRRPAPAPGTRRGQGWEAPPPGTAPASGWERRCPDPPAPPFILERGGGREIKAAPALPGAPGGGARCGGAACCRPGGALLPPIAQGRGPWEGEARAHLPDGRRCGGAGPEPPRAAEDRGRAGQKGRCRPGRERGALTHLEGRREPGCTGGGLRRSLLVWVTLNLASL